MNETKHAELAPKVEDRVNVEERPGETTPWAVMVRRSKSWAIVAHCNSDLAAGLTKEWLDMAFEEVREQAYAEGMVAGARAENERCEEAVREAMGPAGKRIDTAIVTPAYQWVARLVVAAIAARRKD